MQFDLPNFLLAASVSQALMFSAFLLLPSHFGQASNRLLVVVLLSIAAGYAEFFLYGSGLTIGHPNIAYIGTLLSLVQPPAIYLYTRSLMYRGFSVEPRHALHLLPFAAALLVFLWSYYLLPIEAKRAILLDQDLPGMPTSLALALVIHGLFLAYLVASVIALRRFSNRVKNLFSDIERPQMAWLKRLLSGYAVVWAVSLAYCLAVYVFKSAVETRHVLLIAGVTGFALVNLLLIYALRQSALFAGLSLEEAELLEPRAAPEDAARPTDEEKNRLERFMDSEKPYLNANLSLNQLARGLGVAPRELSLLINRGFHQNFFDFVGDYRLRHAAQLLDRRDEAKTVLEVMLEAGFNSKSVFNTAFKEKTGLTPTQYRKRKP